MTAGKWVAKRSNGEMLKDSVGKIRKFRTEREAKDAVHTANDLYSEQLKHRQTRRALRGLMNYVGGWDEKDPKHPIRKAMKALGVRPLV